MGHRRKGVRMEMTSLMDVMFLVLVFFIYSIFNMAVHRGVKVELPNASGVDEKGERLVATILPDDTLQLNGEAIGRDALVEKVAAQVAAGENPAIIIAGDKAASLGVGIELLSRLKAIGIEKVSFQVSGQDGK